MSHEVNNPRAMAVLAALRATREHALAHPERYDPADVANARDGVVRLRLVDVPRKASWQKMRFSRALDALEAAGAIVRFAIWPGGRNTHVILCAVADQVIREKRNEAE